MQEKTNEELLDIWVNNDRDQWLDRAFEAISLILPERGVAIPSRQL